MNIAHIIEGNVNAILHSLGYESTEISTLVVERLNICASCPLMSENRCMVCRCPLKSKLRSKYSSCPKKKW